MRRALICGISGQDGAYLAQHLLNKGYEVGGTSSDAQPSESGCPRLRSSRTTGYCSRPRRYLRARPRVFANRPLTEDCS